MTKTLFRAAASLGLLALVFHFAGPARVLAAFANASPAWLAAALTASVAASLTSALRWHALADWLGLAATRPALIVAYFRGIAANTVLPGATLGGDALRALQLQRLGHPLAASAASVALDRMSGLWVLAVLSLATTAAAQFAGVLPPALLPLPPVLTLIAAIAVLAAPTFAWLASRAWHMHLPGPLERALTALHDRPAPLRHLTAQFAWSAGVQGFSMLTFALAGRAVGLDLPLWLYVIAAGPVFILAALPVSVGGWGTREAAAAVTLGHFGASTELAIAAAMLYGIFAVVQGAAGALSLLPSKQTAPPSQEKAP
ncbi:MAG: flippase-like domain-containing protein [Gammaproteobacteria bacterium]|nr:flippase-like domain-containing protein [Gammaproteobacteria bacterium]MBU1645237.1 flippase-like domain-containing protein [Gammaproteobacteria bacterium]MBU1971574.1 flippase-like domain-containing protein [Gammaproteobacteria bacterium]